MNQNTNFVSVIIPVFNDKKRLELCLKALENQTYPQDSYEVIIVDNGSDESIESIVNRFNQALAVYEINPGSYTARNKGISLAKGEILAFTDSDCIPVSNWLETAVKHLLSLPKSGVVAGKIEFFFQNHNHPNSIEIFDSMTYLQQKKYVDERNGCTTANLITYKKLFEKVGYFNSQLKSGGDFEWCRRAVALGYSFTYAENCCVFHPARSSFFQLYKKLIRVTRGGFDINKSNIDNHASKLKQLVKYLYRLKPPLRSIFRRAFSAKLAISNLQKYKLAFILLFAHYVRIFELIKLQLGDLFTKKSNSVC